MPATRPKSVKEVYIKIDLFDRPDLAATALAFSDLSGGRSQYTDAAFTSYLQARTLRETHADASKTLDFARNAMAFSCGNGPRDALCRAGEVTCVGKWLRVQK